MVGVLAGGGGCFFIPYLCQSVVQNREISEGRIGWCFPSVSERTHLQGIDWVHSYRAVASCPIARQ